MPGPPGGSRIASVIKLNWYDPEPPGSADGGGGTGNTELKDWPRRCQLGRQEKDQRASVIELGTTQHLRAQPMEVEERGKMELKDRTRH